MDETDSDEEGDQAGNLGHTQLIKSVQAHSHDSHATHERSLDLS